MATTRDDLAHLFGDLLGGLTAARAAHCRAVGTALLEVAHTVPARYRADLVTAGVLHDIGYTPSMASTGFHPIDGAAFLSGAGFSPIVCDLVATHTIATREADLRGLGWNVFEPYVLMGNPEVEKLRQLVTWADLTTGPTGRRVTVQERLEDILSRYGPETPVHRYVTEHRGLLEELGSAPPAPGVPVDPLIVAPFPSVGHAATPVTRAEDEHSRVIQSSPPAHDVHTVTRWHAHTRS